MPCWVSLICDVLEEKKAQKIHCLDVKNSFPFADTLICATGLSDRHLITLCTAIERASKGKGVRAVVQGKIEKTQWIVISVPGIFVHLFLQEAREYYQLESLWTNPKPPSEPEKESSDHKS